MCLRVGWLIALVCTGCGRFGFEPDDAQTLDAQTLDAFTPFGDITIAGGTDDTIYDLAVDGAGHFYAVGRFGGTLDFGAGNVTAAGAHDAFVASYEAGGTLRWVRTYSGSGDDDASGVIVMPDGRVMVTGHFEGPTDFLGGAVVTPQGPDDAFLLGLTEAGDFVSIERYGGSDAQVMFGNDDGNALAIGPGGRLIMGGTFRGTADFGAGAIASIGTGTNGVVAAPAPINASPWSFRYGDARLNTVRGLAADGASVYVAGYYEGAPDLGTGALPSAGIQDGVVVRLDGATGAIVWAQAFGGSQFDYANRVGIGFDGTVFAAGFFQTTVDFGQGPVVAMGARDAVLLAYSQNGAQLFAIPFGSSGCDDIRAMLVEPDAVWVTGTFESTLSIGAKTIDATSGRDTFLARFDYTGGVQELLRVGDTAYDAPTAIVRTQRGTLLIAGTTNGPGECGGASGGDGDGDIWLREL